MSKPDKPIKISFAPGCFDSFEGTQEELDELIAEITAMAESGEMFIKAMPANADDLSEEELELVLKAFEDEISPAQRKLQ